MSGEDEFEPRLGRMRAGGSTRGKRFLNRILAAANLARGGSSGPGGRKNFSGSRLGRGAGVGRVLSGHDRFAAFRARRVIVKSRIMKLAGKGSANARAHLRYLQRDGTTREGAPGMLYGAQAEAVDGKAFLERGADDRHQFRLIVSPEDGDQYSDLKPVIRRLMAQMEEDLDTRLDWVAVDHFNTGHPHSHILLRGRDDRGRDLILARDYLAQGIRARAGEILDLDLGPRSDLDIERRLRAEVEQGRFTSIDRRLLAARGIDRVVSATASDPFEQTLRAARLAKLERMGLAEPMAPGFWRLEDEVETVLRALGERGDIVKTLARALRDNGVSRPAADQVRFEPGSSPPLVGAIVERGLSDELRDRHYLIVDGADGRAHYVDIGLADPNLELTAGMIIRAEAVTPAVREADRAVAAVAAANGGRYGVDLHLRSDPGATSAFAETHVRRLEAMRRAGVAVTREVDGSWRIAADHLERAAAYEAQLARARPVRLAMLSRLPLEQISGFDGETWIDRRISGLDTTAAREAGFGAAVLVAERQRRQWLQVEGLLGEGGGSARGSSDWIEALRRRELLRLADQLSSELGLSFTDVRKGQRVEGLLERKITLGNGNSYALVRRSKEFSLVPWRSGLERRIGRAIAGRIGGAGLDWSVEPQRGHSIS
jgi:type IV secretory pathway VirD2 relaxase